MFMDIRTSFVPPYSSGVVSAGLGEMFSEGAFFFSLINTNVIILSVVAIHCHTNVLAITKVVVTKLWII